MVLDDADEERALMMAARGAPGALTTRTIGGGCGGALMVITDGGDGNNLTTCGVCHCWIVCGAITGAGSWTL